jgi:hypothetical protein
MSEDQFYELQKIAKMLIEARDEVENLQSWDLAGTTALHVAISQAHWLCHRICDDAQFQRRTVVPRQMATAASLAT